MRDAVLFVHILAASGAIGPSFVIPIIGRMNGEVPVHSEFGTRLIQRINRFVVTPANILLLVTGLALIGVGDWSLGDEGWLWLSLAIFVLELVLAVVVLRPIGDRLMAATSRLFEPDVPEDALPTMFRLVRASQVGGTVVGVMTLVVLALMVSKPW